MTPIRIGKTDRSPVTLDVATLVDTRLLVCANSGGGKSYLLRGIAEQSSSRVPTIVLDPEGEFSTLREKVDAVLVSRDDGDVVTDARSASLLARKLLELGLSAIIDLSDLRLAERRRYMRLFLEAIMGTPKKLWRPTLILVDEAHQYAPQQGQSEAMDAVISLMSQGRKRGFCGVLATQRLSKLHKDAAAEANNLLIGRTTLDLDLRRACDLLQKGKGGWTVLQNLAPGEFFAFGPALNARGVVKLKTAKVKTTHPQSGRRHMVQAPQPSAKIRNVLPEFADLPKRATEEAKDLETAKGLIRKLEREQRKLERDLERTSNVAAAPVSQAAEKELRAAREQLQAAFTALKNRDGAQKEMAKYIRKIEAGLRGLQPAIDGVHNAYDRLTSAGSGLVAARSEASAPRAVSGAPVAAVLGAPVAAVGVGGKRRMLIAVAQMSEYGCDRTQLALMAGMSSKSGTFSTYLGSLRSSGLIEEQGGRFTATSSGIEALGDDYEPLPIGKDLAAYWLKRLGNGGKTRILGALLEAPPGGLSRIELARAAGLSAASGTFATYLGHLRSLKLIEGRDPIKASEMLT